jgi:hypothetical protein
LPLQYTILFRNIGVYPRRFVYESKGRFNL